MKYLTLECYEDLVVDDDDSDRRFSEIPGSDSLVKFRDLRQITIVPPEE